MERFGDCRFNDFVIIENVSLVRQESPNLKS